MLYLVEHEVEGLILLLDPLKAANYNDLSLKVNDQELKSIFASIPAEIDKELRRYLRKGYFEIEHTCFHSQVRVSFILQGIDIYTKVGRERKVDCQEGVSRKLLIEMFGDLINMLRRNCQAK